MEERKKESWNSRFGVILAVAGSAVGLGNFLRFPSQAAEFGGGAFMLAYFVSFLLLGLPICWAEWTLGRRGGRKGFNSCPAILAMILRHPKAKYLGVLGVAVPVTIYMYYVNIEAWCLGYAWHFVQGALHVESAAQANQFWSDFVGIGGNGMAFNLSVNHVGVFLLIVFILNFVLISRGLSRGIELFCTYAMPTLVVTAFIIMLRVLTLGTPHPDMPERNVSNGLGFMWNPTKVVLQELQSNGDWTIVPHSQIVDRDLIIQKREELKSDPNHRLVELSMLDQLSRPELWLKAAGQIFFSLSVGFGVILTYASYLKESDDIVLSALAASSANEFCEVAIGGLMTLPAAVAFMGVSGVAGMGTFGLGFNALPMVFSSMAYGYFFGFLFFFLLFLAAVTSSLSLLQPGIAFLEEALFINRRQSVAILGFVSGVGALFICYFSGGLKALDTMDFWAGIFSVYILGMIEIITFGWGIGLNEALKEANKGASMKIPSFYGFIMKYVSPIFLLVVFLCWLSKDVLGLIGDGTYSSYIRDLFIEPNQIAIFTVILMLMFLFYLIITLSGSFLFQRLGNQNKEASK